MLLDINSFFYSWIRGGIFLLLLYHFVFYLKHREEVYKYYSVYLLGVFIFLIKDVFNNSFVNSLYEYLIFSIQFIAFYFYIHFTRKLLNTEKDYPKWDKASIKVSKILLVTALLLILIQAFWGYEVQKTILLYGSPFLSILLIGILAYVEIIYSKEGIYSLLGSIVVLIAINITVLKIIKGDGFLFDIKVHNMFYYFIGILIQTIIYAFLLADVLKNIEEDKSKIELNLFKKSSQLYELKMTAFKNQMNPHFLFNSLNSINNFVLQNKKEEASNYITKFSNLIRKVLQTTENKFIDLEEELRIAELYLKIEQMRLRNSFIYKINIDEYLIKEKIRVVPLFMQPFLENAIWHGLSLSKDNNQIIINIKEENNFIYTEIIDNGVGINASYNQKKNLERKSYGIKTIKNRMELIYKKENFKIGIEDLSQKKKEKGTKVSISFPKNFK